MANSSNSREQQPALVSDRVHTVRILMIEDDDYYYRFVRQLLRSQTGLTFELSHANSLAEASRIVSLETPDVILLDLKLPDSSGLSSLEKMRDLCREAPIVILTGSDDEQSGLDAVALGAQDYLVKHRVGNDSLVRCMLYSIERRKSEQSILRLSTIRDFTATLAHDLQVPLIGSNNVFDALLAGQFGTIEPDLANVLEGLKESNSKQLALVRKLLQIYRYEVDSQDFDFTEVNIKELLPRCVAATVQHFKSSSVVVDENGNLPTVQGNEPALCQLFCNLLDNAIKYSDGTEPVRVSMEVHEGKLAVHIHNAGTPIPEEVQNGIFEKFWQGVPGRIYVPNTGLGLYLCKRIVSLHKGKLACRSSAEEGTTITVRLCLDS